MLRLIVRNLLLLGLVALCVIFFVAYITWGDSLFVKILFHVNDSIAFSEQLRKEILDYGRLAPFFFVCVQILQVILAPVPGEASGFLGGYLFGAWPGFLYSTLGLTLGSVFAFAVGRLIGELMPVRFHQSKIYQKFNHLVAKGDFVVPFLLFILPGFPKDSLSYLLGFSHIPLPVFIVIAGVGRIPGTLMLSFQGAEVYLGNYWNLLLLIAISAAVTIPCYLFRKKLLGRLSRYKKGGNMPPATDIPEDR